MEREMRFFIKSDVVNYFNLDANCVITGWEIQADEPTSFQIKLYKNNNDILITDSVILLNEDYCWGDIISDEQMTAGLDWLKIDSFNVKQENGLLIQLKIKIKEI